MEKVEAYRCEKCNGKGLDLDKIEESARGRSPELFVADNFNCYKCEGTGIVWLTKEEAKNEV